MCGKFSFHISYHWMEQEKKKNAKDGAALLQP